MGFFSMNEHANLANNFEFPVVEGYDGTIGCGIALVEGYQNDLALFTAAVQYDMSEMYSIKEGVSDEVLQEGAVDTAKRMWEAIKQFFIKLGAKIKSIFTAFIAKLQSYFTKDLKGFVEKYRKNIQNKNFKGMKAKYAMPKGDSYIGGESAAKSFSSVKFEFRYNDKASEDEIDRAEWIENYYSDASSGKATNKAEYKEYVHELAYNDEEVKDDWDYNAVNAVANRLVKNTKALEDLNRANKSAQDSIKKIIDNLDKEKKAIDTAWGDAKNGRGTVKYKFSNSPKADGEVNSDTSKGDSNTSIIADLNNAQALVSQTRAKASCYQDVVLGICSVLVEETKWGIAQDKRIFTKAVAAKSIKESVVDDTLLTAIEECAADEVFEYFDNPAIVA